MLHRAPDDDAKGRCLQLTRLGNEDGGISNKEDLDRGRIPVQDECQPGVDGTVRAKSSHGGSNCVKKGETESGKALEIKEMPRVKADIGLGLDIADACAQQADALRSGEEGDDLSENDLPKNDAHKDDVARARNMALQVSVSHGVRQAQLLQQQQQAPTVRWERFLPQRQLRVLLVEDDDSTRHVVSALLRNCSYEVTSAANGLLAWELLLDQTSHVDLVLTEVAMPSLSGIGLLSRIMGHQAYKHIPVIMMSSHDSMSIVFKCLSRGAVDFLVKPVRKNELKNLWQHVWRRCHSSSGSGSGSASGSLTQKATPAEGAADCNNSGSNDESDNASSGLNVRGGSDNGSGTQSSWTKRAVEVESCHQRHRDSSHGNAILSQQAEKGCASAAEVLEKQGNDIAIGEDLELATVGFTAAELKKEDRTKTVCLVPQNDPDTIIKNSGQLEQGIGSGSSQENSQRAIDLIGAIACNGGIVKEEQGDSRDEEDLLEKHASNSPSSKDKTLSDSSSPASLELTLKRPRHREEDNKEKDGRYVLRHSCSSAFSRYNNNSNNNHHIPVNSGNPLPTLQSKPVGFTGPGFQHVSGVGNSSPSSFPLPTQVDRVASSKDRIDGGQSLPFLSHTCHGIGKQESSFPSGKECSSVCTGKEESLPSHLVAGPGAQASVPLPPPFYDSLPSAAFGPMSHPLFYAGAAPAHWAATPSVPERGEVDGGHVSYEESQAQPNNQHSQIHHHSHHHHHHHIQHHYHHHQHVPQQRARTPQQEDQTVTNVGTSAPLCGSSNMAEVVNGQSGSSNGNNGNISLNCSATGSNNGSNGHSNAQSAAGQTAGGYTDGYTDGNQGGNGSSGAGTGFTVAHGVLSGADQNRFARREAALTKFRQKRKERCFEKKVRYQSRKRLAEQRPRVRGQFVRQSVYESINNEPD